MRMLAPLKSATPSELGLRARLAYYPRQLLGHLLHAACLQHAPVMISYVSNKEPLASRLTRRKQAPHLTSSALATNQGHKEPRRRRCSQYKCQCAERTTFLLRCADPEPDFEGGRRGRHDSALQPHKHHVSQQTGGHSACESVSWSLLAFVQGGLLKRASAVRSVSTRAVTVIHPTSMLHKRCSLDLLSFTLSYQYAVASHPLGNAL
jgi:hypothetical protein